MKLVARHSLSEANNRNNFGTPAFGHADAPLMPEGRAIAQEMGKDFQECFGVVPEKTKVAVSGMLRSQETATEAGFADLKVYTAINEVDTKLPYHELRESITSRQHTTVAIKAAELILENPPEEEVWISHGLVIASLCEVLGISYKFERFIPKFCEIRELPI